MIIHISFGSVPGAWGEEEHVSEDGIGSLESGRDPDLDRPLSEVFEDLCLELFDPSSTGHFCGHLDKHGRVEPGRVFVPWIFRRGHGAFGSVDQEEGRQELDRAGGRQVREDRPLQGQREPSGPDRAAADGRVPDRPGQEGRLAGRSRSVRVFRGRGPGLQGLGPGVAGKGEPGRGPAVVHDLWGLGVDGERGLWPVPGTDPGPCRHAGHGRLSIRPGPPFGNENHFIQSGRRPNMSEHTATNVLRAATRDLHGQIENTPLARAFLDGSLNIEAYVGVIRVLTAIQAPLERQLPVSDDPLVARVWTGELGRLEALLDDNDFFRRKLIPDSPGAVRAGIRAASHILLMAKENPAALLGAAYVLGGSTKGAVILAPRVAQSLGLSPGRGLSYLTRHAAAGPSEWDRTAEVFDMAVTDPNDIQAMTTTALTIFHCLLEAFEALWPLDKQTMRYTVTGLNPEAGNHAVPQDRRDLEAVLRATDRCLAEHPYFMLRYGLRGLRFSDADGAWLATLPGLGAETTRSQVDWLAGVLAARGIPRILLARHLEILSEELSEARPDRDGHRHLLAAEADRLRVETGWAKADLEGYVRRMEQRLGWKEDFFCREAVQLLASAMADEASGLKQAVSSLTVWLADPSRFSREWVENVTFILADMEKAIKSGDTKD
ncbi:MAG: biliverdin-producing heme oxygenase [Deltaproteobacteria bacterium]|nr:biliverdin-producing heme oxygenase [Deltaproteobacteria bacterium]